MHKTTSLSNSTEDLLQQANDIVTKIWRDELLILTEVRGTQKDTLTSSLVTTIIIWHLLRKGICLLELFGGIGIDLTAILQAGIKLHKYVYVDNDPLAKKMAINHS